MFTSLLLSKLGAASEVGNDLPALTSIYSLGGHNGSVVASVRKFNVNTLNSAAVSATLSDGARYGHQTGYSATTAYSVGGANASALYVMDAINMVTDTASNPANGALSAANGQPYNGHTYNTLVSSLFCGGIDPYGPTYSGKQYQLVHSTEVISTMAGKLLPIYSTTQSFNHAATSKTNGYKTGGSISTTLYREFYRMSFSTFLETLIAAQLGTGRTAFTNLQDTNISYSFGGGPSSGNSVSSIIDKFDMTTETNSLHTQTCQTAVAQCVGGSTSANGYAIGGFTTSVTSIIQNLNFSTGAAGTNAINFGAAIRLAGSAQI